tara:strand:+ start:7677 stop:8636 length:960 start_codon:yes stop_codon:yes gene_type:complete
MENQEIQKEVPISEQPVGIPEEDTPEIEVVDDTPKEDQNRKKFKGDPEPTEDELNEYSEGVQKRVQQLTHARHDERREKERIARERDELAALTKKLLDEKRQLQQNYAEGEKYVVGKFKQNAEQNIAHAKKMYKDAHEAGDSEAMAMAQQALTTATLEQKQYENFVPRPVDKEETPVISSEDKPEEPVKVKPDKDTINWVEKNDWWFGPDKDRRMTGYAYGVHDELVAKGIDPRVEPEVYYTAIDRAMRETFPDKFAERGGTKPSNAKPQNTVVAPVKRTANGKVKVTLTATQERIARRLGISKEQYARELVKLEQNNG